MTNTRSRGALLAVLVTCTVVLSACYYPAAYRYTERTGGVPWWCQGTPDLTVAECLTFSAQVDSAVDFAHQYLTLQDFMTAGATAVPGWSITGSGVPYILASQTSFDPLDPNVLFFADNTAAARPVGVGWAINDTGSGSPAAFANGPTWLVEDSKYWQVLRVLRGYENHPDVFSVTHPCLATGVSLTATTDACFVASHTVPLEVLVTNDDGYSSPGVDELVNGLTDDPNDPSDTFVAGINVQVVAPLTQQSGQGDNVTPGGAPAASPGLTTTSGYPVLAAVHGTPADSVIWSLQQLLLSPDVVLSGINSGQNLANLGHLVSGTIGAARTARRRGSNAIATSQGGPDEDWDSGVTATLALLEEWRLGNAGVPYMRLPNINIPSCPVGSIRGTIEIDPGVDLSSGNYFDPSDCLSTKPEASIVDDLDAFLNGFISIGDMGQDQPPNYP